MPATRRLPRNRFEQFLFRFIGPPQLGDLNDPVKEVPPVQALCPCGLPYEIHERKTGPQGTYTVCP